MEAESIIEIVKTLLFEYGIKNFYELSPQNQKALIEMERYFQKCNDIYENIKIKLENNIDLSIRGICKGSGIAKSTIYKNDNKPILKEYIDNRLKDNRKNLRISSNVELIHKLDKIKVEEENKVIQADLDLMIIDKIRFFEMEKENKKLYENIQRLTHKVNILSVERANIIKQYNELNSQFIKLKNKEAVMEYLK